MPKFASTTGPSRKRPRQVEARFILAALAFAASVVSLQHLLAVEPTHPPQHNERSTQKSEPLGKAVLIALGATAFSDSDVLREAGEPATTFSDLEVLREASEAVAKVKGITVSKAQEWIKQSRVFTLGIDSVGIVTSTAGPEGKWVQVKSRMKGKEVRLWVAVKDITEDPSLRTSDFDEAADQPDKRSTLPRPASAYNLGKMTCDDYADFVEEIVRGRENGHTMKQPPAQTMKDALARVNAATDGYPDERKKMTQIVRTIYAKPRTDFPESRRVAFIASCQNLGWGKASAAELADGKIRQFQKFRLGDFSYEIRRCDLRARLGPELLSVKPGAGGVFLVVRFAIANETKKTKTVLSDDFILRDGEGREFSPASNALMALMMEGENKDFLLSEIQPGVEKESVTAFEIPKTALSTTLLLVVPEKGIFGSKTAEVLIKPQTR